MNDNRVKQTPINKFEPSLSKLLHVGPLHTVTEPGFRLFLIISGFRGLWTLEERRNRADLIEVFKILNGFSVVPVDRFFALLVTILERSLEEATAGAATKISDITSFLKE